MKMHTISIDLGKTKFHLAGLNEWWCASASRFRTGSSCLRARRNNLQLQRPRSIKVPRGEPPPPRVRGDSRRSVKSLSWTHPRSLQSSPKRATARRARPTK